LTRKNKNYKIRRKDMEIGDKIFFKGLFNQKIAGTILGKKNEKEYYIETKNKEIYIMNEEKIKENK